MSWRACTCARAHLCLILIDSEMRRREEGRGGDGQAELRYLHCKHSYKTNRPSCLSPHNQASPPYESTGSNQTWSHHQRYDHNSSPTGGKKIMSTRFFMSVMRIGTGIPAIQVRRLESNTDPRSEVKHPKTKKSEWASACIIKTVLLLEVHTRKLQNEQRKL